MAVPPLTFRSVFISDLHLGSAACKAEEIQDFLSSFHSEKLYLVGDVIDLWVMLKKGKWNQSHTNVVRALLGKSKRGCQVYFTPGNHDAFLRKVNGAELGNIYLDDAFIHELADGRQALVIHGDQFDKSVKFLPLAMLGAWMFEWVSVLNAKKKRASNRPLATTAIKKRFKKMISSLTSFEDKLAWQAALHDCSVVICGHIHRPALRDIDDVLYGNCGDWVENLTAIVEHFDGRLELLTWPQIKEMIAKAPKLDIEFPAGSESEVP